MSKPTRRGHTQGAPPSPPRGRSMCRRCAWNSLAAASADAAVAKHRTGTLSSSGRGSQCVLQSSISPSVSCQGSCHGDASSQYVRMAQRPHAPNAQARQINQNVRCALRFVPCRARVCDPCGCGHSLLPTRRRPTDSDASQTHAHCGGPFVHSHSRALSRNTIVASTYTKPRGDDTGYNTCRQRARPAARCARLEAGGPRNMF